MSFLIHCTKNVNGNYLVYESYDITGVLVAAARTHKGWCERRRQRVCSLPLGECFSELLSRPKHTQLWWLSSWMPWLMHAFVPQRVSHCQRWQVVIWWCCPGTECRVSKWFWQTLEEGQPWIPSGGQSTLTRDKPLKGSRAKDVQSGCSRKLFTHR